MTTVLSNHRFLHTTPGFASQQLLARINSPRLEDMPSLSATIDAAADAAGISRELLCCIPQKEQSGLTLRTLSAHALADFCGYDGGDGVPQPGTEGPKLQLLAAAKCLRRWYDAYTPGAFEHCPDGDVTASNAATYALYRYTNTRADKANLLSIWREFGFGNPLEETTPMPADLPTSNDVAAIARAVVQARLDGQSSTVLHGVPFDMEAGGWCLRFVGRLHVAAFAKHGVRMPLAEEGAQITYDYFPWFARYASQACRTLAEGGTAPASGLKFGPVSEPNPGDIVLLSPGYTAPGHIAIFLGQGLIAENTSSAYRGDPRAAGTKITPLSIVRGRITGYARVLPSSSGSGGEIGASPFAAADWEWACANGLFDGSRPHDPLTREEAAVVMRRLWGMSRKTFAPIAPVS